MTGTGLSAARGAARDHRVGGRAARRRGRPGHASGPASAPTWSWSTATPRTSPSSATGCARSTSTASRSVTPVVEPTPASAVGPGARASTEPHPGSTLGVMVQSVRRPDDPVSGVVGRVPRRAQGAHPAADPRRGPRPVRGQQPGGPLAAPGGQGGRHRADRLLPALRLHRGPRPGPRRGVVRLPARDAPRRTPQRPDVPHHHRQLGARCSPSTPPPSTTTSPSSPASASPGRPRCARPSGTRSTWSSASSPPTSRGSPTRRTGRPRTCGCSPT